MNRYLVVMLYVDGESAHRAHHLAELAVDAFTQLQTQPGRLYRVFPNGGDWREYQFKKARLQDYLEDSKTGTLGFRGTRGLDFELWTQLELRESPVGPGFGAPLCHSLLIEVGDGAMEEADAIATAQNFLTRVVEEVPVLHGGITVFERLVEAEAEITFIGENMDDQPTAFVDRWEHDALCESELWDKLRRVYWNTFVGSKFTSALGGIASAKAAGALWTREIGEGVLFGTTDRLAGSQDKAFLEATKELRRWIWPHSIQNPVDAP